MLVCGNLHQACSLQLMSNAENSLVPTLCELGFLVTGRFPLCLRTESSKQNVGSPGVCIKMSHWLNWDQPFTPVQMWRCGFPGLMGDPAFCVDSPEAEC